MWKGEGSILMEPRWQEIAVVVHMAPQEGGGACTAEATSLGAIVEGIERQRPVTAGVDGKMAAAGE